MNILYVCADPGIPVRGTKGASVHVRATTDAFAELGHPITLLTPRPGPADGIAPRARLVEVRCENASADREARARGIAQAVCEMGLQELGRDKYDFIYERYSLWSDAGAGMAQKSGIPLVLEVNAPLRVEASRYRTLERDDLAAEIERRVFSAADALAVVSEPLRDYVIERGADAARVLVLPNAVDEKIVHPAVDGNATRTQLGLNDKFVIGFVGTVKPWHDLDTLIQAFAQVGHSTDKSYHLLLVGEIPESVRDKILEHGLGDRSTVVPTVPHDRVPEYLAAMDVAVSPHPALNEFYFSPLKLFEYLACGRATVAADVAPVRQVIANEETGLLYQPGNASELAQRIERLAQDRHLRAGLGWAGARRVLGHHTWKRNAEEVIARVCGKEFQPRPEPRLPLFDDRLGAHLFRATRADLATPLLAAHLTRRKWDSIAQIQILKYKPRRRCVIAYDLMNRQMGNFSVIAKVFKDERGAEHLALQRELWANGFGAKSTDGITIAEPLGYIPEMRMLVQERAAGQTLDECVGSPSFPERVEQSARAIAKLHSGASAPQKSYILADELDHLTQWAQAIVAARPPWADWSDRQLAALRAQASHLTRANLTPTHRDFYYSQLLFSDHRVTLIDLDMFSLADPAIDVANFSAHLQFLALQKFSDAHALDDAVARFLDAYARYRREADQKSFSTRVAFYRAATVFRLLHVVLNRPHWDRWFQPLAALTERTIAQEP